MSERKKPRWEEINTEGEKRINGRNRQLGIKEQEKNQGLWIQTRKTRNECLRIQTRRTRKQGLWVQTRKTKNQGLRIQTRKTRNHGLWEKTRKTRQQISRGKQEIEKAQLT